MIKLKERPKCIQLGCNNLAAYHNKRKDGSYGYKKLCTIHNKEKYGIPISGRSREERFPNTKCELCEWVGPCDRHRLNQYQKGTGYIRGNVIILCPNCHRLEHMKEKGKYIAVGLIREGLVESLSLPQKYREQ